MSFAGMLALHAVAVALLPGRPPLRRPVAVVASASAPATQPFRTVEVAFGRERYGVSVQALLQSYTAIQRYTVYSYTSLYTIHPLQHPLCVQEAAAGAPTGKPPPPLLLIPPVGVGIDRKFYDRLQVQWAALGAPAAMHSIDLLGTGSATPKPARFYSPEVWAEQVDAYIREELKEPCVLVVQGGLLPSALEVWRRSGAKAIAGVSVLSPPPLSFFTTQEADEEPGGTLEAREPTDAAAAGSPSAAAAAAPAEPLGPGDAGLTPSTAAAAPRARSPSPP